MTGTTLRAFHNDKAIKAKYLARVRQHRLADDLVHGVGWRNGKGCAIGCTLEAYDHRRYPLELGIPEPIAYLEDAIFEGLPNGEAQLWPEKVLDAISVGADLSMVWPKFAVWLMDEVLLYSHSAEAEKVSASEWEQAIEAARAAIEATTGAAWAAAEAAEAVWTARAAAWAAAEAAEAAVTYERQAQKLLELLREAGEA